MNRARRFLRILMGVVLVVWSVLPGSANPLSSGLQGQFRDFLFASDATTLTSNLDTFTQAHVAATEYQVRLTQSAGSIGISLLANNTPYFVNSDSGDAIDISPRPEEWNNSFSINTSQLRPGTRYTISFWQEGAMKAQTFYFHPEQKPIVSVNFGRGSGASIVEGTTAVLEGRAVARPGITAQPAGHRWTLLDSDERTVLREHQGTTLTHTFPTAGSYFAIFSAHINGAWDSSEPQTITVRRPNAPRMIIGLSRTSLALRAGEAIEIDFSRSAHLNPGDTVHLEFLRPDGVATQTQPFSTGKFTWNVPTINPADEYIFQVRGSNAGGSALSERTLIRIIKPQAFARVQAPVTIVKTITTPPLTLTPQTARIDNLASGTPVISWQGKAHRRKPPSARPAESAESTSRHSHPESMNTNSVY